MNTYTTDFNYPDLDAMSAEEFIGKYKWYIYAILKNQKKIARHDWDVILSMTWQRLFDGASPARRIFDPSKGTFHTFLGQMVTWVTNDFLRRELAQTKILVYGHEYTGTNGDACDDMEYNEDPAEDAYRDSMTDSILKKMQEELAPKYYLAFVKYGLNQEPIDVVCRSLGINVNQAYLAKTRGSKLFIKIGKSMLRRTA